MLQQIIAITLLNLRALPQRWGASMVAIIGIACVVAVFMGLFAIGAGFDKVTASTTDPDMYLVMREGAPNEGQSPLHESEVPIILASEYLRQHPEGPAASPEFTWGVRLNKRENDVELRAAVRGITPAITRVYDGLKIVEGRLPQTGRFELMAGSSAHRQFKGLELGNKIKLLGANWEVVGIFENLGGVFESELWADLGSIQGLMPLAGEEYQSVRVKLRDEAELEAFRAELKANPQLQVDVQKDSDYFASFGKEMTDDINMFAIPLIVLMVLGAVFAALNTMFNSVAVRAREIATLRALGFRGLPIAVSTMAESMLLALIGALLGSAVVYLLFNGLTTTTMGTFGRQWEFSFLMTADNFQLAVLWALLLGLLGGAFPALRAARAGVAAILRES